MAMVTDDFNRANGGLGANWTASGSGWSIVSNQARAVVGGDSYSLFTGAAWTGGNDHYSQAQYVTVTQIADQVGVAVRLIAVAVTCYAAFVDGTDFLLFKVVAGVYTLLGAVIGGALTDTIRCEAVGTTISSVLNGTTKSTVTDASISVGNPGLAYTSVSFNTDGVLDSFAADSLGAVAALLSYRRGGIAMQQRML